MVSFRLILNQFSNLNFRLFCANFVYLLYLFSICRKTMLNCLRGYRIQLFALIFQEGILFIGHKHAF